MLPLKQTSLLFSFEFKNIYVVAELTDCLKKLKSESANFCDVARKH